MCDARIYRWVSLSSLYNSAFSLEEIWPGSEPVFEGEDEVVASGSKHFFPSAEAYTAQSVKGFIFENTTLTGVPDEIYYSANMFKSGAICHPDLSDKFLAVNIGALSSAVLPYWGSRDFPL